MADGSRQGAFMCRRSDHRESASSDIDLDVEVAHLRAQLRRVEREDRSLRGENAVLREAADPLIHQAPARERFAFIYARRDRFSVTLLCRILVSDRGSYYAWVRARGKRVERQYHDRRLTELILEVRSAHPAYGVPRATRKLQRQGVPVGRRIVTRLMQRNGISGAARRRRRNLT